ncbi:Serpentine receptor class gamma [Caenorhabditis elegans]|uniref:Serpentine receptor class gamma n=1 Tax=Caenorhabditis elegans TaxID=6239 RepID=A0A0K3AR48_CAEEL|nr:Serpentine receptor class gamma [Caenorhabditis elegans]CTQ86529.1 Serpentine receptor class gamma [Caenorhabditis elegans]|eukprot:NP_001300590.1 Uncharacterized protein CELE_T01D1.5 [Caenorhabditis elegans]
MIQFQTIVCAAGLLSNIIVPSVVTLQTRYIDKVQENLILYNAAMNGLFSLCALLSKQEFLFGDRSFTIRAKPHSSVLAPYIHCIQPFVLLFFAAKSAMYAISLVYNMGRHQKKKTIRNSFQSMKIIIWMLMPLSIGWIWFLPDAVITVLGKNNTVNAASSIKDLEYSVICFSELTSYSVLALITVYLNTAMLLFYKCAKFVYLMPIIQSEYRIKKERVILWTLICQIITQLIFLHFNVVVVMFMVLAGNGKNGYGAFFIDYALCSPMFETLGTLILLEPCARLFNYRATQTATVRPALINFERINHSEPQFKAKPPPKNDDIVN